MKEGQREKRVQLVQSSVPDHSDRQQSVHLIIKKGGDEKADLPSAL